MADKPRFIRKNGRVIPIGGKANTHGRGQSKGTVKRRLKGLKRAKKEQTSPLAAAAVGVGRARRPP